MKLMFGKKLREWYLDIMWSLNKIGEIMIELDIRVNLEMMRIMRVKVMMEMMRMRIRMMILNMILGMVVTQIYQIVEELGRKWEENKKH